MTAEPTTALTPRRLPTPTPGSLRSLLEQVDVQKRFEQVLGSRANQFIANLASVVHRSPALAECVPSTVIAAGLIAASLDLPLDPNLGYACMVPFNNNRTGKKEAQFQMQWKGYIQLAHRTRQYKNIHLTEVYEGEVRSVNRLTGELVQGARTGDTIIGYLAYFRLTNGFEKFLYMTIEELEAHGKRYSKGFSDPKSMWKKDPEVMYRKTPIKLLLKTYGVLSVDMQRAIAAETPPDDEPAGNGNGNGAGHGTAGDMAALYGADDESDTGAMPGAPETPETTGTQAPEPPPPQDDEALAEAARQFDAEQAQAEQSRGKRRR